MTVWTTIEPDAEGTEYWQLEPYPGYGGWPFGDPSDTEYLIHSRGFGDPTTDWRVHEGD